MTRSSRPYLGYHSLVMLVRQNSNVTLASLPRGQRTPTVYPNIGTAVHHQHRPRWSRDAPGRKRPPLLQVATPQSLGRPREKDVAPHQGLQRARRRRRAVEQGPRDRDGTADTRADRDGDFRGGALPRRRRRACRSFVGRWARCTM